MNIFRTPADCTKMSISLIHKLTLLVPDGKMGIFLSFFLSSCNLGTSRLSFRALQLTFLRSQLQSLRFCKEMPFFPPFILFIFFYFGLGCVCHGEFSEQNSARTELLSHTLCSSACTGFLGPALKRCLKMLPAILCRNVILHVCLSTTAQRRRGWLFTPCY